MSSTIKKFALSFAVFVIIVFVVFVFNQTVQIVQFARTVNMAFGNTVLWILIFVYCILVVTPVVLWFRLPKRLVPPASAEGVKFTRFMVDFRKRLSENPLVRGLPLSSQEDIENALIKLDKQADEIAASNASVVFLGTALSQNGQLDGLVVLAAQTRLVWQTAYVYNQRPSLRDFIHLYANVAATAFVASGIEDVDLQELLGPGISSAVTAIPGMQLIAGSIFSGSANAFLTLRVGMITKEYCRSIVKVERRGLRRAATLQAVKLLGSIVQENTTKIAKAGVSSAKNGVKAGINAATKKLINFISQIILGHKKHGPENG